MALATKVYENINKERQENSAKEENTESKKDDVADAEYEEK